MLKSIARQQSLKQCQTNLWLQILLRITNYSSSLPAIQANWRCPPRSKRRQSLLPGFSASTAETTKNARPARRPPQEPQYSTVKPCNLSVFPTVVKRMIPALASPKKPLTKAYTRLCHAPTRLLCPATLLALALTSFVKSARAADTACTPDGGPTG